MLTYALRANVKKLKRTFPYILDLSFRKEKESNICKFKRYNERT